MITTFNNNVHVTLEILKNLAPAVNCTMKPSFSFLFSGLFLFFILHSIWNLISIFRTPFCAEGEVCYKSYLNSKPNLDLLVFISDSSKSGDFDLILKIDGFDYSKPFDREISVDLTKTVRNNGSIVIHTLLLPTKFRRELNIRDLINSPGSTYLKSYLTKYAIPLSATFNLLKDETKKHSSFKPVTHIRSKYAIVLCSEDLNIPHTSIPVEIIRHLKFNNQKQFLPIIHRDIMQMRLKDLVEITEDMTSTNFSFIYNPISYGKLRFLLQIDSTLYQFIDLGFSEKDLDEVKSVFADTNLYLLCMTVFIGSIHLLLDFLSFKNDVSFWKTQKSMAGLSTRTVFWRAFSQTVIFFYLLDEGTSLLVIIPSGIATLIEFWKVSKILKTTISWRNGLKFNKDSTESQEEMKTREYDEECMQYLSYVLYPLCFSAAVYSLLYQPHKSWYSWTISSLVNGVYAFGFLFMLPQLFINYRLKSVAALPWRAFTYRAFNTFIDDIFAFIITMPTAHRLACFRDDIVFLVYLYQRWLYPVDKSRRDDLAPGEDNKMAEKKEDKKKK